MPKNTSEQPKKSQFAEFEEEIAEFWEENDSFQKSVEMRPEDKQYVFYDGPPFATGLPHYGHMLASTVKDSVPRFWTMRGYRVERRWGWDCHGLPIENLIEKEVGLNSRKDIEEYGIDKFNEACRASILKYDSEWAKFVKRIGRWVDFENSYKTMDNSFMESVWWAFKELHTKELVYEGRRVSLYCPRCATPLSNFEIAMDNSYKDVQDNSLYVKFAVTGEPKTYLLAWTTTPWTLPGNVGLGVDAEAEYVKVEFEGEQFYCAKLAFERLFKGKEPVTMVHELKGQELVGKEYEPLYSYMPTEGKKAHYVLAADFVKLEEGTGIVHTAAIYGEDDFRLAQEHDLPLVPTLDEQGKFLDFVTPWAGQFFKKAEESIIQELQSRNLVFFAEKYTHSYPFCWRCETPLYYYAGPAWFIDIQKIKPTMLEQNEEINWRPEHLKKGRFGNGLETAPDWNVSRSRFWGTAIPVWKCSDCEHVEVIGSVKELEEKSGKDLSQLDLHRPYIDEIGYSCTKCPKGSMKRISDVFDCWVESGAMPFAEKHYPFENKEKFEQFYPADFISEYIAQTRGWFYTLHVLSTALFGKPAFLNAVTSGTLMAEDGNKMSKSKKNYPEPQLIFDKYCVDAVRYYLLSSSIMDAAKVNFSEKEVDEIYKKLINTLWNVFTFYKMFAETEEKEIHEIVDPSEPQHILDQWILSKFYSTVKDITSAYESYDIRKTAQPLLEFVQELSTWYVRRSRGRFKSDDADDRHMALRTLYTILINFVKIAAPVTPFITEKIYQELRKDDHPGSIHHCDWPYVNEQFIQTPVLNDMQRVREDIEKLLALRSEAGIKVRQALASATIMHDATQPFSDQLAEIIREEVNVKQLQLGTVYSLDTTITEELRLEGMLRELVRQTNSLRKKARLTISDQIEVKLYTSSELIKKMLQAHQAEYAKSVLAKSVELVDQPQEHETTLDGEVVSISFSV